MSIIAFLLLSIAGLAFTISLKVRTAKKIKEKQLVILEKNQELNEKNEELATVLENLKKADRTIQHQNQEIKKHNQELIDQVKTRTDEIIERQHQVAQFAYLVSHDLRGPVARIMGLRNLLSLQLSEDELQQIIDRLGISITEVDQTIRDISKIFEASLGIRVQLEWLAIDSLLNEIQTGLRKEIEQAESEVKFELLTEEKHIFTSRNYLRSIIDQLLLNALKFRDETKPSKVTISVKSDEEFYTFIMHDNGLGIDLDKHRHELFTPYKRFHTHRTGKGFNLYLVKHSVESLGGSIELQSRVNEFTAITFKLPKIHREV